MMRSAVFFADAGDLRERLDVAAGHRAAKGRGVDAAQDVQGDLRADAADGVDEQAEEVALAGGHEAVKHMGILADDEMREQLHFLAGRGELVERRQGDQRFVADAADLDDDLRGQRLNQFAVEKGDHGL
jgi:hypothetical protein